MGWEEVRRALRSGRYDDAERFLAQYKTCDIMPTEAQTLLHITTLAPQWLAMCRKTISLVEESQQYNDPINRRNLDRSIARIYTQVDIGYEMLSTLSDNAGIALPDVQAMADVMNSLQYDTLPQRR